MKKVYFSRFILLVSILLLFGCGTKKIEGATGNQGNNEKQPFIFQETKGSIEFTIELNQKNFSLEDEIMVEVSATNNGKESVPYYAGSSSCVSHVGIQIVSQETNRHLVMNSPNEPFGCTDDIHVEQLDPLETVREKGVFLPKEQIQSSQEPASGGSYEVVVFFHPEGEDDEKPIMLKTEISIESENEDIGIISEEEAEVAANQHKEVQEWIQNHTGENISKVENGEYYILFYDGWTKTIKEEYDKLRQGIYQDEKQIQYVNGNWEVSYLSKLGSSPHRIKVVVDGVSGKVLSVEMFDR